MQINRRHKTRRQERQELNRHFRRTGVERRKLDTIKIAKKSAHIKFILCIACAAISYLILMAYMISQ